MTRNVWDDRADRFERRPLIELFKWGLGITLVVLAIVATVGLLSTGSVFFRAEAAKRTVNARTKQRVFTPENKIAQIAFFHDTCNTARSQLQIAQQNEAKFRRDERTARFASDPITQQQATNRLDDDSQDVTGAMNQLVATANAYNSRSAQSTANVFKGTGLPDRIRVPQPLTSDFTIECG